MISGLSAGEGEEDPSRGQKLWAVLLVLDAFFVIIFGGALAAKLYQHWQSPPQLPPPVQAHRPKPAAPKLEPPMKTEPAPAPAPSAKPALVEESPKPRETPKLQEAAKPTATPAAPPVAAPAAKVKAKAVKFQIKAPGAKNVELWGGFIRGGRKAMTQESDGIWTLTLYLTPATYRYLYLVDGIKTLDPENARSERNASALTVAP